ncbi:hypothetical protein F5884DRAFT_746103 [Xylogone sp. PMI_703]|nr:hypothetical protein F5884DRAFT_746103 [Xylogone sp. PMI_703]
MSPLLPARCCASAVLLLCCNGVVTTLLEMPSAPSVWEKGTHIKKRTRTSHRARMGWAERLHSTPPPPTSKDTVPSHARSPTGPLVPYPFRTSKTPIIWSVCHGILSFSWDSRFAGGGNPAMAVELPTRQTYQANPQRQVTTAQMQAESSLDDMLVAPANRGSAPRSSQHLRAQGRARERPHPLSSTGKPICMPATTHRSGRRAPRNCSDQRRKAIQKQ